MRASPLVGVVKSSTGRGSWVVKAHDCATTGGGRRHSPSRFLSSLVSSPSCHHAFALLDCPALPTDPVPYASLLKSLGSSKSLQEGKFIHTLIISHGLDCHMLIMGHLVQMYGACGAFDDAFDVFGDMDDRNVYTWNFIIRACARHGEDDEVIFLREKMQQEGVIPTKVTYVSIFDACAGLEASVVGHRLHAVIVKSPIEDDIVVGTALVNMYGKFGSLGGAWLCFNILAERDVVAWTALISAISEDDQGNKASYMFDQMLQEGTLPNEVTFISLCGAYAHHATLLECKRVHVCAFNLQLEANIILQNALIDMYGKRKVLKYAESLFKAMSERSLVSWTAIISAYAQHGHCTEAIQHFVHMQQLGLLPDNVLLTTILSACVSVALLSECKHMHAILLARETERDFVVGTVLITTYGKCGDVASANSALVEMVDRNTYCWNAVIGAYINNGQYEETGRLYDQMQEEGVLPDKVTFLSILDACGNDQSCLRRGVQIHAGILCREQEVENALLEMYGKHGKLHIAESLFNDMLARDSITWTILIKGFVQHGQMAKALQYFDRMLEGEAYPDGATFVTVLSACNHIEALARGQQIHALIIEGKLECDTMLDTALVSMYGKCISVEDARSVFDGMVKRNEVSWNAIIAIYEQVGLAKEALELFEQMLSNGMSPDNVTFVTVVSSCITEFALVEGKLVHAFILESGCVPDVVLVTAMVNMYGKCGSREDAQRMFDRMEERNVVSWNAIIAVYAQHGLAVEAGDIFRQMQVEEVLPNIITFVNVLGACSHCGYLQEVYHYFNFMIRTHYLRPTEDNYVCLVDLFGRAGCLDEAEIVLNTMPMQPSVVSFMALLGACRYRDDAERGKRAADQAVELEPETYAPYLVLSNLYVAVGRMEDATSVMSLLEDGMVQPDFMYDVEELHDILEAI